MKRTIIAALLAVASLSASAASAGGPSVADTQNYLATYDKGERAPLVLGTVVGMYAGLDAAKTMYGIPLCPYPIAGGTLYEIVATRIREVTNPELLKVDFTTFAFITMKNMFACSKKAT